MAENSIVNKHYDVAVIGAGPAGLAAALSAAERGASVCLIERDAALGGILQQCVHAGFGLSHFGEELTGPEYAGRFADELPDTGIDVYTRSMVIDVTEHTLTVVSATHGYMRVEAAAIVLAMGCRERTRGNLRIPGYRPQGVYTAGLAQYLVNRKGFLIGKRVVVLGSGDIGMIMARRMTLVGAEVVAVVEIMPYLAGLMRNKVQCLDDFGIPLYLSHTVTFIDGKEQLCGVRVAAVDERRNVIPDTERYIECDTLLLSVGLIPENELSLGAGLTLSPVTNGTEVNQYMQSPTPYYFACGNVLHVNDLVDNVTAESQIAGKYAAMYAAGTLPASERECRVIAGEGVRYVTPARIALPATDDILLSLRVTVPVVGASLAVRVGDTVVKRVKKRKVTPGEIETITVKASDITDNMTVFVESL